MAPRRTALLVLAALAPARAELQEDGHGMQQVGARVDPVSNSFYVEVKRKDPSLRSLGSAGQSPAEQAKWLGKAALVGVNSAAVTRWVIHPLLRKLMSRRVPPENMRTRHAEPTPPKTVQPSDGNAATGARRWQLSAVVALTAVAALCSSKARGRLANRRRAASGGANAMAPVAVGKFEQRISSCTSDHSTSLEGTPRRTLGTSSSNSSDTMDDSESDLANNEVLSPCSPAVVVTHRQLLQEDAKTLKRQESAPAGSVTLSPRRLLPPPTGSFGNQSSGTGQGPGTGVPRFVLTPAEETRWNVRQRAAEFERKIDFHRMESESSVLEADDNEYERSLELKTHFYRIGTEAGPPDGGES